MRRKYNIRYWAVILGLIFLDSCTDPKPLPPKYEAEAYCLDDAFREEIVLEQPELLPVTENIHLTGSIEPNPDRVVHFSSLADGIISQTYFSEGDLVRKGHVLAELRSSDLAELYTQSRVLVSRIEVAEQDLEAAQARFEDGISSRKELADARSELTILEAEKEKIESQLSLFSASEERGVFEIRAPQTGIVIEKNIVSGGTVSAGGDILFTISDLNTVWVMVDVFASHIKHIEPGMKVQISTLSYPDEWFEGKIDYISQVLDDESRVLKARVVLPNSDLRLKPGMLVDVDVIKTGEARALSIPTQSMVFDNDQHFVVIYRSDCELENRKVEIRSSVNGISFLADGLQENEQIISKNHLLIYEQIKNFQN